MAGGRPPKWDNPKKMGEAIESYFLECESKQDKFTVGGLAYALDLTTEGLLEYERKQEFSSLIKRAKQRIKAEVEKDLLSGKPAAGLIFWLKNHAGMKDEQHQRISVDFSKLTDEELEAIAAGQSET